MALLTDLTKNAVLGRVLAYIYVIEFQKRGLPHAHILLILAPEDKLRSPDDYDKVICAELPDPDTESHMHDIVRKCMMHGPCGALNPNAPCMVDGKCSKGYPREFCNTTQHWKSLQPVFAVAGRYVSPQT